MGRKPPAGPPRFSGARCAAVFRRGLRTSPAAGARRRVLAKLTGAKDSLDKIGTLIDRQATLPDQMAQIMNLGATSLRRSNLAKNRCRNCPPRRPSGAR